MPRDERRRILRGFGTICILCYNFIMLNLKYRDNIFIDWLVEAAIFPAWWYGRGLVGAWRYSMAFLRHREQGVGFMVWVKNIFVPMYGQTDFAGRLISFIVRFVQVLARGLLMLCYLLIAICLFLLWFALPLIIAWEIYLNLNV